MQFDGEKKQKVRNQKARKQKRELVERRKRGISFCTVSARCKLKGALSLSDVYWISPLSRFLSLDGAGVEREAHRCLLPLKA
jgi:hypothetical protein